MTASRPALSTGGPYDPSEKTTVVRRPRAKEGGREEEENRPEIPESLPDRTTGNR